MASSLVETLKGHLENWDFVSAEQELSLDKHKCFIENNAWDLIPILLEPITQSNLEKCPQLVNSCGNLLADKAATLGSRPKEVIISLLEHCEYDDDNGTRFQFILKPLKVALLRLDFKSSVVTWNWTLETVVDGVHKLQIPANFGQLEEEEVLLLENDKSTCDLLTVLQEIATMIQALMDKIPKEEEDNECVKKCTGHLLWPSVQILANPLSLLPHVGSIKQCSSEYLKIIHVLSPNPLSIVDYSDFCHKYCKSNKDDDVKNWALGITLLFEMMYENEPDWLPMVYSHLFVLDTLMPCINVALKGKAHNRGLCLSNHLMVGKVEQGCLGPEYLDLSCHVQFVQNLFQIVVYNECERSRKLAFKVYETYYGLLSAKAKYKFAFVVIETCNHSGLIGHTVTQVKNLIVQGLNSGQLEEKFTGTGLEVLVKRICRLSHGAETDMLEISDEIMSTLNLLVCVYLKDRHNKTGLWNMQDQLERDYVDQIKTGLAMARSHYKLKLRDCDQKEKKPVDPHNNNAAAEDQQEVTLMVGGQALPQMTQEQMKSVIHSALNTFDMMDCVLGQLTDVTNRRKKIELK